MQSNGTPIPAGRPDETRWLTMSAYRKSRIKIPMTRFGALSHRRAESPTIDLSKLQPPAATIWNVGLHQNRPSASRKEAGAAGWLGECIISDSSLPFRFAPVR